MTAQIDVDSQGDHAYSVTVTDNHHVTQHEVVVPPGLLEQLSLGADDEERLVRKSFEFLLERETSTSILSRFKLDVIGHYFPDYVKIVGRRLAAG